MNKILLNTLSILILIVFVFLAYCRISKISPEAMTNFFLYLPRAIGFGLLCGACGMAVMWALGRLIKMIRGK